MAVKKPAKTKRQNTPKPEITGFLFYGQTNKDFLHHLAHSLNAIKNDEDGALKFYSLTENAENVDIPGVIPLEKNSPNPLGKIEGIDYLICISAEAVNANLKFKSFTSPEVTQQFKGVKKSGRIFLSTETSSPIACRLISASCLEYLKTLSFHADFSFGNQLKWYTNRISSNEKDILLSSPSFLKAPRMKYALPRFSLFFLKRFFNWNFSVALKDMKNPAWKNISPENPVWRFVFGITSVLILITLPLISYQAGISGDEEKHWLHAEKVYNYFSTHGEDTTALSDPKYKLNYYGQSFDLFSYVFIKTFNIEKIYETRHVLNGLTGALAIITAGILIRYLAGSFAGFLTLMFVLLFPRFLGHSMNNPLDIPFALGYIFSLYQMIRFLKNLPVFSLKHSIYLTLGIAWTISIRIGGLVLIPYLFMFSGLYLLFTRWPWKRFSPAFFRFSGKGLIYISLISVIAYFLSILPWPYALQSPFKNPFEALEMMSNITVALRVMFEGDIIWSDSLPWNYLPKNMWISIPIMIWLFFLASFSLFLGKKKEIKDFWLFLLFFATLFPVLYIIYKESNVYGGWRHTLFIYPGFAGLAALTVARIRYIIPNTRIQQLFTLLVLLGLTHPLLHLIRNYPLQYIYFNEISGGIHKAHKKYETDYYLNSLKPGTEWLLENIIHKHEGDEKLIVASNAPYEIMKYYYRGHLEKISFPYTRYYSRGATDWDYAVYYCNYIDPYHLSKKLWPPKNTIHEIKVDDVTVCAIVERKNKDDYHGIEKVNSGIRAQNVAEIFEGIQLLEKAIKYNPHNETAFLMLGQAYVRIQQYDKARQVLNRLLAFYPDYDKALNLMGFSFISEGQMKGDNQMIDRGISTLTKVVSINFKFIEAYYNLGLAYYLKGNDNTAIQYLNRSIDLNGMYKPSYYLMAEIMKRNGNQAKHNEIMKYVNSL